MTHLIDMVSASFRVGAANRESAPGNLVGMVIGAEFSRSKVVFACFL